jgi:hypothetical protein
MFAEKKLLYACIGQEQEGENAVPHLQGYFRLAKPIRFVTKCRA